MYKSLLTFGALALISHSATVNSTTLRSGVILDNSHKNVMFMMPEGGMASVNLQSGMINWRSTASDKPLTIAGGYLLSQKQSQQTGSLSLVYHDIKSGETQGTVSMVMPEQVMATVVDGVGHQFKLEPVIDNSHLQWSFSGGKAQGIAPSNSRLDTSASRGQVTNQLTGTVSIDFNAMNASIVKNAAYQPTSVNIEKNLLSKVTGRQFLSQDGAHVLVSERIKDNRAINYHWALYTKDGQFLSARISEISFAPFVIVDQRLIFIEPAKVALVDGKLVRYSPVLKSINLRNQKIMWQHPVRAIRYFGQLPV